MRVRALHVPFVPPLSAEHKELTEHTLQQSMKATSSHPTSDMMEAETALGIMRVWLE